VATAPALPAPVEVPQDGAAGPEGAEPSVPESSGAHR
jgi:hypothetical protein